MLPSPARAAFAEAFFMFLHARLFAFIFARFAYFFTLAPTRQPCHAFISPLLLLFSLRRAFRLFDITMSLPGKRLPPRQNIARDDTRQTRNAHVREAAAKCGKCVQANNALWAVTQISLALCTARTPHGSGMAWYQVVNNGVPSHATSAVNAVQNAP
jgi:hypothetical protein